MSLRAGLLFCLLTLCTARVRWSINFNNYQSACPNQTPENPEVTPRPTVDEELRGVAPVPFNFPNLQSVPTAVIDTTTGLLRGKLWTGGAIGGSGARTYRGIRYATAGRFEDPVVPGRWSGVYDATNWLSSCWRTCFDRVCYTDRSEDCLGLNVYAPAGNGPFPVYVYIHGGGFYTGDSSEPFYDGRHMAATQNIIVVTIDFRLGVWGNLCWHDGQGTVSDGNYQMKDIFEGLTWVKNNIAAFGGNVNDMTIGGTSSGAITVGMMAAAPRFATLGFKNAIMASAPINPANSYATALRVATTFARTAGCDETNTATVMACLKGKTNEELLAAQLATLVDVTLIDISVRQWAPCYDAALPANDATNWIGINNYLDFVRDPSLAPPLGVDNVLLTRQRDEAWLFVWIYFNPAVPNPLVPDLALPAGATDQDVLNALGAALGVVFAVSGGTDLFVVDPSNPPARFVQVLTAYATNLLGDSFSRMPGDLHDEVSKFLDDYWWGCIQRGIADGINSITGKTAYVAINSYANEFKHDGILAEPRDLCNNGWACHFTDNWYMFNNRDLAPPRDFDAATVNDQMASQRWNDMISSFIKTGVPTTAAGNLSPYENATPSIGELLTTGWSITANPTAQVTQCALFYGDDSIIPNPITPP
eukprot:TRINITY_DN46964_c0_g1_i1.p1 TRINITY_DN46964_c0_g1~~TRINITY_DN46964_c0_g1_i1.p1  ORF type:complete len:648 (+),score=56.28 TRINITY_DN46964_c0_g1_i1:23-1966(+)